MLRRALFVLCSIVSLSYGQEKIYTLDDLLGRWVEETPALAVDISLTEQGDGSVSWKTAQEGKVLEETKKEGSFYYVFDPKLKNVIVLSFFSSLGEFVSGAKYKISENVDKYPFFLCLVKLEPSGEESKEEIFRLVKKEKRIETEDRKKVEFSKTFLGTWRQNSRFGSIRLQVGSGSLDDRAMLIYRVNRTGKTFSRPASVYVDFSKKIMSLDVLEENNRATRYFFKLIGNDLLQEVDAFGFNKISSKNGITSFIRERS